MVLWSDPVRSPGRCSAIRRRQPQTAVGKGQKRGVPHPALRPARLPKPIAGHG